MKSHGYATLAKLAAGALLNTLVVAGCTLHKTCQQIPCGVTPSGA